MKTNSWAACMMLALAVLSNSPISAAEVELTNNFEQAEPAPQAEIATDMAQDVPNSYGGQIGEMTTLEGVADGICPYCGSADGCNCNSGNTGWWQRVYADKCPRFGSYITAGVNSWRGVLNGTTQNNDGFVTSANGAAPLPWLSEYGFGWQAGGSYGVYNVDGRAISYGSNPTAAEQQVFLTTGVFRRADGACPIAFGFVHDWMWTTNIGPFDNSPTLGQWRAQVGWAMNPMNEIGVWGSWSERGDWKFVPAGQVSAGQPGVQNFKSINQVDFFWQHKFGQWGGDGSLYFGFADQSRLNQNPANSFPAGAGGTLGSWIVGTNWLVPINDRLSMYANGMYMRPSAHSGAQTTPSGTAFASAQDFWNVGFGLTFFFDHAARSSTIAGRKWMPYMPVANNSTFMIDTDVTR